MKQKCMINFTYETMIQSSFLRDIAINIIILFSSLGCPHKNISNTLKETLTSHTIIKCLCHLSIIYYHFFSKLQTISDVFRYY
jgi:hypothetical protein